jgi:signal transduction histidine kinase/ligand-binding sensor domain-containing protein
VRKYVIILFLAVSISVFAQPYNFKLYNQASGISSSNIKKIQQDSYGFIWMGTQEGLTRFDGSNSVLFSKPQLDRNDISDLFFDNSTKNLWIGYSQGGVSALNTTTLEPVFSLKKYKSYSKIAGITLRSILMDTQKRLWIGTDEGLFLMPDVSKDTIIKLPVDIVNDGTLNWIIKIAEDQFHNILINVSYKGVLIFPKGNISHYDYYPLPKKAQVYNASLDTALHRFLISTEKGTYAFDLIKRQMQVLFNKIPEDYKHSFSNAIYCTAIDSKKQVWLSTNSGLYIIDKNFKINKISLTGNDELDFKNIPVDIFSDRDKNIWLCTRNGCFYTTLNASPFIKFDRSDKGNLLNHLYFLYPQETSLLACDENGLYKLDYSSQLVRVCDSNKLYYLFFRDFKNNTICSNQNGLFIWNDQLNKLTKTIDKIYPEWTPFRQNVFCCSLTYGDTLIILGSDNSTGIYLWNTKRHTITNINEKTHLNPLRSGTVNMLYKRDDHSFWILSDSYIQIFDLDNYSVRDVTLAFPDIDYYFDIVAVRSKYYIACYGSGIFEVDSTLKMLKVFNTKSGLSNNCVYRIIPENDSILWATTNFGLNRINLISHQVTKYFVEDGLNSNEFEEFSANLNKGKIYVGGLRGFTIIDPSRVAKSTKPPLLYFTNIKISTKRGVLSINNLELQSITIPNNWLQATISFAGLNYSNPTRVTYKYRIKEQVANWISNGHQDFISIIGLEPGTYTIQVKAANEDGFWSEPRQLTLIILPKWYQTLLFKILVFVLIVAFLYTLYKLRLSYLKKQHQIRQSISADLHDDIGGTLNSIKMFAHMADISENKQFYLNEIKQSVNQASIGLRDMIWVLDDKKDTVAEMIERLRQFAIPAATAQNINVNIIYDDVSEITLDKTVKRNFLLIAKESINNAIKYSGCKNISVTFSLINKKLSLRIKDDGKGFDMDDYTPGNGLRNIKERANQINYKATIYSKIGSGTEIIIVV